MCKNQLGHSCKVNHIQLVVLIDIIPLELVHPALPM